MKNKIIKWITAVILNALCAFVIFANCMFIYLKSLGVALLVATKDASGIHLSQFNMAFFIANITLAIIGISIFNLWIFKKELVRFVEVNPNSDVAKKMAEAEKEDTHA